MKKMLALLLVFSFNEKVSKYLNLDKDQQVVGYLYVGTPDGEPKKIPNMKIEDFVTKWRDNEKS